MEITKEDVITVALEDTVDLLAPYMREVEPSITQDRIDNLMNLMTIRPDLMAYAKNVARDYFLRKFEICIVLGSDGNIKKLY